MKQIAVVTRQNGSWGVIEPSGEFIACKSNAEAWRKADVMNNETLNREEHVHDWSSAAD